MHEYLEIGTLHNIPFLDKAEHDKMGRVLRDTNT